MGGRRPEVAAGEADPFASLAVATAQAAGGRTRVLPTNERELHAGYALVPLGPRAYGIIVAARQHQTLGSITPFERRVWSPPLFQNWNRRRQAGTR